MDIYSSETGCCSTDHWGINPKGIVRAFFVNIFAGGVKQGGSTITQQLAKILLTSRERSIYRKVKEAFIAVMIEAKFSKNQIDPCGENGEFHTFVYDGPIFRQPVIFNKGEIVYRKYVPIKQDSCSTYKFNTIDTNDTDSPFDYGFWYCDLLHQ